MTADALLFWPGVLYSRRSWPVEVGLLLLNVVALVLFLVLPKPWVERVRAVQASRSPEAQQAWERSAASFDRIELVGGLLVMGLAVLLLIGAGWLVISFVGSLPGA